MKRSTQPQTARPSSTSTPVPVPSCLSCRKLETRVRELERENAKLLAAVQRESFVWDQRAPHTGRR